MADEDPTTLQPQEDPQAAPPPADPAAPQKPAEVGDAMAEIEKRGQLKGKDDIKGKIRVLSRKDLEEIIAGLLKKYGSLSNQELIAQLGALEMQTNQDKSKHERELEALRAEANAALEAARNEAAQALENLKLQYEAQIAQIRETAAAEVRERLVELERLVEQLRAQNADLEARLAALQAEYDKTATELAVAKKALDSADKRTKAELLKQIADLQARIMELEMALAYFSLEEEFDTNKFTADAGALADRLQAAGGDRELVAASRVKDLQTQGLAEHLKFEALLQKMHEQKASVGVVVDLAKILKKCETAAARAKEVDLDFGGKQ